MIFKESIIHEHSEWVTISEFAKRLDTGVSTVNRYIAKGKLQAKSIKGSRVRYMDWNVQSKQWKLLRENPTKKMKVQIDNPPAYLSKKDQDEEPVKRKPGRPKKEDSSTSKKKKGKNTKNSKYMSKPKSISVNLPKVSEPEIEMEDMPAGTTLMDLSELDPMRYSDCWKLYEGKPVLGDDGKPLLNYELLQDRLKAETFAFKLQKEKGEYVAKADVITSVQALANLIRVGLDSIPSRYASRLIAEAKRITHHDFTEEEKSDIKAHLSKVSAEILKTLQADIKKLLE